MKNEFVKFRATALEKDDLKRRAREAGVDMSEFIRSKVFEGVGPLGEGQIGLPTEPQDEVASDPSAGSFGAPSGSVKTRQIADPPSEMEVKRYAYQNGLPLATARRQMG